ncbi:MAG: protein-L-isoaspartate(D-aspartate) O-methyltransferase [Fidelibacterota bacterium]
MDDPYRLKQNGITDKAVLEAFHRVKRIEFIDDPSLQKFVNADDPLPIGEGQTISQPSLVAHMTQCLNIQQHHHVLEIGTGSGFQAAVIAEIASKVTTIEVIPGLCETAQKRLDRLGYKNVSVILGDGYDGYLPNAPYDRIMVTAAAEEIPEPLILQLKTGGKMIIPIGSRHGVQQLYHITKHENDTSSKEKGLFVRFVPFVRKPEIR